MQTHRLATIAALALSLVACKAGIPGEEDDNEAITAAGCGVERWSVKTGTDSAASQVNMTPQDTTIQALGALPIPSGLSAGSARFTGSAEAQAFRLTNVTLSQYKLESDSDYHIDITDGSGHTMITEIPSPSCVSGGPWAQQISAARAAFNAKFTPSTSFQTANVPVTIVGVGFYDLPHGQTGIAPNGIELHSILSICFPGSAISGCAASTPDFGLAANPASVSGATATSSIAVSGSGGFSGSVALSASGVPAGASATLSPASISSGGTSTLSLNAGSAAAGTYAITVTGTSGTLTHTASVSWTIAGGGGGGGGNTIVDGDFENGLTGWTAAGTTSVSSVAHGGSHSAQVGSATSAAVSSVAQTFTVPAGGGPLSFWYQGVCHDTVQYAWATATLKDNTTGATSTLLPNTCTNTGQWVQVTSGALVAGHSMTLTLSNHGEVYQTSYGYTLYDDVVLSGGSTGTPDFTLGASPASVSGATGSSAISVSGANGFSGSVLLSVGGAPAGASASLSATSVAAGSSATLSLNAGSAAAGSYAVTVTGTSGSLSHSASVSWTIPGSSGGGAVVNGDFETGTLSGWTVAGQASVVSSGAHGGAHAAMVGSTSPSTDSSISQQIALPSGSPKLSFWYKVVCPDTIQYDWASVTVKSATGSVLTTPLANTCTNGGAWVQGSADLTAYAGQTVVLSFNNHDDNYAGDPTYTLYDDIQVSGGSTPAPDFTLSSSTGSVTGGGTAAISASGINGFSGSIALSASGAPSGASASVSPSSIASGGSATLTLSPGSAAAGTYPITVAGTSGSLSHQVQISWTIGTTVTPDFSLSLASSSATGAATDSVTVTPSGGFSSAVSLSVSGVPTGGSASFSPASVTSGSSTLTLTPGTAANGTYSLTVSGSGGGLTHTAALSWTLSSGGGGGGAIQTVFIILMENHNWSQIGGSASAPYINNTLLPQASYALNYQNPPGNHPSLPNYLWLEAGTNFGILDDNPPSTNHQSTSQHLVTLLQNSGVTWRSYQEGISGTTCPLATSGLYAPKHNPMVYFDDVTNTNNASSANCINHVRPYTQLATDLQNNAAARYNFITPNLCDDMHNLTGCAAGSDAVKNGDTWLSQNVPAILASAAYRNNGVLIITWDESEGGDVPIGMIVLSPKAKGHGYTNSIAYTHASTLRTMEEIFSVQPFLGAAASATDLSDLFTSFP